MEANFKDGEETIRETPFKVKRGQLAMSEVDMEKRWGWSRGKVRRFLDELKTEQMIEQQTTARTSLITITNYELYQGNGTTGSTPDSTADSTALPYKKKDKKDNRRFQKPSLEEVYAYCKERGKGIIAQDFIDHYETNGWMRGKTKIKSWKACVRTWENKRKGEQAVSDNQHHSDFGDFTEQLKEAGLFKEPEEGS